MRKTFVIAMREYQAAVKTKAFMVSLVLMPVMMGGSIVAQKLLENQVDIKEKKIAIIDQTGVLADAVIERAKQRNEKDIFRTGKEGQWQAAPKFTFEKTAVDAELDATTLKLSDRVRNGEINAFLVIHSDVLNPTPGDPKPNIEYHSNSPTYDDILDWVTLPLNEKIREARLRDAKLDPEAILPLTKRTDIANLGLVSRDEATGTIKPAQEANRVANFFVPLGMMMLMFMMVMVGATPLMQGVLEEKTNRIAEVLIASVSPFQLMLGKLIGMVGVSMTIVTIYMVGAYYALERAGFGEFFPKHLVWWFVVYQVLAILLFGSLFTAIGAAVTDAREAQSLMTPVMLLVVSPMFVWINVVKEPSSTFSTIVSLVPTATPMLMVMRQAVPPGVPLWQPVLGVVLVVITTLICVFAAGRIFRVGILMQGRGAKFGEMLGWVFKG